MPVPMGREMAADPRGLLHLPEGVPTVITRGLPALLSASFQ